MENVYLKGRKANLINYVLHKNSFTLYKNPENKNMQYSGGYN
jgi:hypothetical protein